MMQTSQPACAPAGEEMPPCASSSASKELQKKGGEGVPGAAGFQVMVMMMALLWSLWGARHLLGMMLQPRLTFQMLTLIFRLISSRG